MEIIKSSEFRKDFSEYLNRAKYAKERLSISINGKLAVALIPIEDLDYLEKLEDEQDYKDGVQAKRDFRRKDTVAMDDVVSDLGLEL